MVWFGYDSDRLAVADYREIFRHGTDVLNNGNCRSPFVCHFLDQQTGRELLFVTVHLGTRQLEIRQEQAVWRQDKRPQARDGSVWSGVTVAVPRADGILRKSYASGGASSTAASGASLSPAFSSTGAAGTSLASG